jgi:hypothetical protein
MFYFQLFPGGAMKKLLLIVIMSMSCLLQGEVKILTNHLGYDVNGPKRAVIQGLQNDVVENINLLDSAGKIVWQGKAVSVGKVDAWKNWFFWTVDFSTVKDSGEFILECRSGGKTIHSFPFLIEANILEKRTLSNVLYYFKGQRCSGALDQADRDLAFDGDKPGHVDLHGGWYDATGDYGKHLSHLSFANYFNPQQTGWTVYSLWLTLDELEQRADRNFRQYSKRLVDEAFYGSDYLVRCHNSQGSFYLSVSAPGFEKKAADRRVSFEHLGFTIKQTQDQQSFSEAGKKDARKVYETSYRSGGGMAIAALAQAARHKGPGDFSGEQYLAAATEAFAYLEQHNLELINDGRENIIDDYCALAAAYELFKTTKKDIYLQAARKRAANLCRRLAKDKQQQNYWRADDKDRPFFHAADAGFPVVALLNYLELAGTDEREKILACCRQYLQFELALSREKANPFGYARQYIQHKDGRRETVFFYPHDSETAPWWQGENARLSSIAAAARLAARHMKNDPELVSQLQRHAQSQLDWILGLNPFDACMLHGSGRNNPFYWFFGFYEYSNAPGGICNGITSGFKDEHDIDFNLTYQETGADHDWRWGEQWLPHASWYLYAIVIR